MNKGYYYTVAISNQNFIWRLNMNPIPRSAKVVAVVCNQFGDTGKGKVVDYITNYWNPKYVVRPCGADNAGHTMEYGGKKIVTHIIPSGIIHDSVGVKSIVGMGAAVNLITAKKEIKALSGAGISTNGLMFSVGAKMILPQHILLDRLRESRNDKIGTTGRGVGPVYSDHVARIGLTLGDLQNKDIFVKKLIKNMEEKFMIFRSFNPSQIKKIMFQDVLCDGCFYDEQNIINIDAVIEYYYDLLFGCLFKDMIYETEEELRGVVGKEKILLEGSQGILLDVDEGTYPFVTSSNCSPSGLARGAGLRKEDVDFVLGIVKAPYMTRVGSGPFPTEIGGLNAINKYEEELKTHSIDPKNIKENKAIFLNYKNHVIQAGTIGVVGNEFGATTGRPRRIGWLDLVALKYSIIFSGKNIVITKPDVLSGCEKIPICVGYIYRGKNIVYGNKTIKNGDKIDYMITKQEVLENCEPEYVFFPGWHEEIGKIKRYKDLPKELRKILEFIKKWLGVKIIMISVGPDRDQTIVC